MTARELLDAVADALKARGHSVAVARQTELWSNYVLLARVLSDGSLRIRAAQVFNGHTMVVPDGCDSSTVTPGSRYATVERIVDAIEKRMAARAKSLPVPVDPTAEVRDP